MSSFARSAAVLLVLLLVPPALAADAPDKKAPALKRSNDLTEQQLQNELARTPELSITQDKKSLLKSYKGARDMGPTILLQTRPDFRELPVRSNAVCQLDPKSAATLGELAGKLHLYLDALAPADAEGKRGDPLQLSQVIRNEMRGKRPEWLRAEAVPTLRQLLMHEATPLREMLVEMLEQVPGRAASVLLAQTAVFDLAPDLRAKAVRALKERPREEYRRYLLESLRYPWAPAAAHAAEALVALGATETVPQLVSLLKEPDPEAPFQNAQKHWMVREVVRFNHVASCLACHPPATSGNELVMGYDWQTPILTTPFANYAKGLGESDRKGWGPADRVQTPQQQVLSQIRSTKVAMPLIMRGDITYMRQDFSVQLPLQGGGNLRFDFLVRTRPLTKRELKDLPTAASDDNYDQRRAVLFALRELTGKNLGSTTEAWVQAYPHAEFDTEAVHLKEKLLKNRGLALEQLVKKYTEEKGEVYTQALAEAVPELPKSFQELARKGLVERLGRVTLATLHECLEGDNAELRRAAVVALATRVDPSVLPALLGRLEDEEPKVAQAAQAALQELTGKQYSTPEQWKGWWAAQRSR